MAGMFFVVILIVALNEFATDMFKTLYQNNEKEEDYECCGYKNLNHPTRD